MKICQICFKSKSDTAFRTNRQVCKACVYIVTKQKTVCEEQATEHRAYTDKESEMIAKFLKDK